MYKLGRFESGDWVPHRHPPVFAVEQFPDNVRRIVAGVDGADVFSRLVAVLTEPYQLLYVLHTPRGGGRAGRYQSDPLDHSRFRAFVEEFGDYLSFDARFDVWAYSVPEQATIVWDRHNLVFAYGPLDRFEGELRALGYSPGEVALPAPHAHNYQSEFDSKARQILETFNWSYSSLHPEDEQ